MAVVFVLWLREVKKYLRSRVQIVASLGAPLMYLGVRGFGLGPVFQRAGEGNYLQFMAPGVIGMTVLFTAMFSGIAMLWDRQFGFLKETLVAPVPRLAIMIGRTLGGATVAVLQGALIFVVTLIAGFRPESLLAVRSEEHTSELQSRLHLVCRLLLEKKHNHRYATLQHNDYDDHFRRMLL